MQWFEKNITANHLASLCDVLEEGIFFIDAESRILKTNAAFRKALGYGEQEVTGLAFPDISAQIDRLADIVPDQKDNILSFKLYYFDYAAKQSLPFNLIAKNGDLVPVTLRTVIFKTADAGSIYGVGIAQWKNMACDDASCDDAARDAQRIWELEQTYQNILKSSGDAIVITDFNGWIVDVNRAFLDLLGYEHSEEVMGKYLIEFVPIVEGTFPCSTGDTVKITKQWQEKHVEYIDSLFEKGGVKFESYVVARDGMHIPIDATMTMLKDQNGQRGGTVSIFKDITERIRAQQEMQRSKIFMDNVFNTTGDGIYVTDSCGSIKMVNSSFCTITGYSEEELIGKYANELLADTASSDMTQQAFDTMFSDNYFSQFEDTWQKKDGRPFPVEAKLSVLTNRYDEYDGLVGSIRDITKRWTAEKELRVLTLFLENVFATASDGIYVTDALGHFIMVNQAFCALTGYARDDLIGLYAASVLPVAPDENTYDILIEAVELTDGVSRFETSWKRKNELLTVEVRIAVLEAPDGSYNGIVAMVRDITERKRMEKSIMARERQLSEIVQGLSIPAFVIDTRHIITHWNKACETLTGKSAAMVVGTPTSQWPFAAKNSPTLADLVADSASFESMRERFGESLRKSALEGAYELEYFFPTAEAGVWMFVTAAPIRGSGGEIASVIHTIQDITARKQLQEVLQRAKQELEVKVQERTADLEEANTALSVMLQMREKDKKVLESDMLHNITQLVMPHVEKLKACRLNERQLAHVEIIQKNLADLIAPILSETVNLSFTPSELQVSNLIRQGKTTKEISEILNIGLKTVDFHRDKIRKKIGLKNRRESLHDFLVAKRQHETDPG